jgi:hypothetical protein
VEEDSGKLVGRPELTISAGNLFRNESRQNLDVLTRGQSVFLLEHLHEELTDRERRLLLRSGRRHIVARKDLPFEV